MTEPDDIGFRSWHGHESHPKRNLVSCVYGMTVPLIYGISSTIVSLPLPLKYDDTRIAKATITEKKRLRPKTKSANNFAVAWNHSLSINLCPGGGGWGAFLTTPPGCSWTGKKRRHCALRFWHAFSCVNFVPFKKIQPKVISGQVIRSGQVIKPQKYLWLRRAYNF